MNKINIIFKGFFGGMTERQNLMNEFMMKF